MKTKDETTFMHDHNKLHVAKGGERDAEISSGDRYKAVEGEKGG